MSLHSTCFCCWSFLGSLLGATARPTWFVWFIMATSEKKKKDALQRLAVLVALMKNCTSEDTFGILWYPLVSCSWSMAWFVVCHFVSLVSSKCVYCFQRKPILCIFLHTCTDFNHPGSGNMLSGGSDACETWWPRSTVRNHAIRPKNDSQKL